VSRIYDALTMAEDQVLEKFGTGSPRSGEPTDSSSDPQRVTLPTDGAFFWRAKEQAELPGKVGLSPRKMRNILLLAFLSLGGILLGTNYALRPTVGSLVSSTDVYGVAFEGTLHPANEIRVTSQSLGTVAEIYVKVGDPVRVGQQIMRMDNRDAQMVMQQAAAEREAARQNLASYRARLAEANARVAIAQRQAEQVPMRQRGDSPKRAQANYDQALVNYNRAKQLFDSGIIAQQELDSKATELRIAQDDLDNAKRLAGASARLAEDQTEQAGLEAQATRQDLLEQLRQADLKYQQAQQRADETIVRATQAGVIAEIPVRIGDSIPGGTVLAKVAELKRMIADVPVAATMISQLKSGEPVLVKLPSNPPTQVQGTIRTINPLPSPNMTHSVEVEFENPTLMLLAGQPAEVRFVKP